MTKEDIQKVEKYRDNWELFKKVKAWSTIPATIYTDLPPIHRKYFAFTPDAKSCGSCLIEICKNLFNMIDSGKTKQKELQATQVHKPGRNKRLPKS